MGNDGKFSVCNVKMVEAWGEWSAHDDNVTMKTFSHVSNKTIIHFGTLANI